jgi:FkbM family methyltransferase
MYYSQCEEDIFLNTQYFKNKKNGIYIELGALDGVLYSNTKFFEDSLGWKGILIEPHPIQFTFLQKNRPSNLLFNNLVSCNNEPLVFKYFLDTGLAAVSGVESTLSNAHYINFFESENEWFKAKQQTTTIMHPKSLSSIIKSTEITHIDFLSLDVEGHEYEVLQSWDFSVPIDLILIEMLGCQTEKDELCRKILIQNGYSFIQKYKHNEIFILNSSKHLFDSKE